MLLSDLKEAHRYLLATTSTGDDYVSSGNDSCGDGGASTRVNGNDGNETSISTVTSSGGGCLSASQLSVTIRRLDLTLSQSQALSASSTATTTTTSTATMTTTTHPSGPYPSSTDTTPTDPDPGGIFIGFGQLVDAFKQG